MLCKLIKWRKAMNSQQLVNEIEVLPPELQKQVFDFVAFLKTQQLKQQVNKRTVGGISG